MDTRREDLGFIAIDGDRRRSASETVFHEYVHHLLSGAAPGLPLWLEEGLAELYQTFEVAGGTARVGLPIDAHLAGLRQEGLLPLDLMRSVHRDHSVYRGGDHRGRFYSQSWAMVHYLLLGAEDRRGQVARFVDLLGRGAPEGVAFADAFGEPSTLQDGLAAYVERRTLPFVRVPVTVTLSDDVRGRLLPPAEAWARLGQLLAVQRPPRAEAEDHFRAALEHDPSHGLALSGLAGLAEERADWESAAELHRRAAEAAPSDPHVLFRSGAYLLERGGSPSEAIRLLRAAVGLAPSLGPAWTHLAAALDLVGDDPEETLRVARAAVERIAAGDLDGAIDRLEELDRRVERGARSWIDVKLEELRRARDHNRFAERYNRAVDLLEGGRPDAAVAVLDELLESLSPGPDADAARRLRDRAASAAGRP